MITIYLDDLKYNKGKIIRFEKRISDYRSSLQHRLSTNSGHFDEKCILDT